MTPNQAIIATLKYIEHLATHEEGLFFLNRSGLGLCTVWSRVLTEFILIDCPDGPHDIPYIQEATFEHWSTYGPSAIKSWPEHSGDDSYPIQVEPFWSPRRPEVNCILPMSQFNESFQMFGDTSDYTRARMRLVAHVRQRFELLEPAQ